MSRTYVSFDWALKRILRDKANFCVLEGFLSELLHDDITIIELLDSEANKEHSRDKFNRVDLLVKTGKDERIIIEVQNDFLCDYFQRMSYGTAKVLTENMSTKLEYREVKRIISVSVVYFDLGEGPGLHLLRQHRLRRSPPPRPLATQRGPAQGLRLP
jgi:predicted transposase/invertase (TIGR01784 family)